MTEPTVISSCEFGCTRICKARLEGCASDCPALPWQPPIPPRDATDAKPDVGAIVEQLNGAYSTVFARSLAKRAASALLALQAEVAALREWKKQILIAAGAQENDDVAKWICNSDAEVARLTQERDAYLAELRGPVKNGAVQKLGKALTRILDSDAWNGIEPLLNSAQAERDRLTQENARLEGDGPLREIAELCCELAYQVFQKEDGTRHVVLDNQGRKVWMLSDELMRDLRAAINGGSVGGGDLG